MDIYVNLNNNNYHNKLPTPYINNGQCTFGKYIIT